MAKKKPFDKEQTTKISFSELVELIGSSCDYKFCIVDDVIVPNPLQKDNEKPLGMRGLWCYRGGCIL